MTLNIRRTICALLCLASGTLFGQEMVQRERTAGELVFFEVHYILTGSDTHKVEALYRVRHDFFTFLRAVQEGKETFTAKTEAAIEILDSTGNSVARQIKSLELESKTNVIQELRKRYSQGKMSFHLPAGKFTVLFNTEDKESKRVLPDVKRPLAIPFQKGKNYSPLIPVMAGEEIEKGYRSFNLNGDVEYSKNFGFLFVSPVGGLGTAKYVIKTHSSDDDDEQITVVDTAVQCKAHPSSTLSTIESDGEIHFITEPASHSAVYYIPVNGVALKQGRYEITITFADSVKAKGQFAARWLDMPMSLNDLDLAMYPLQHILTKDDYSDLNSGNRSSRIEKFERFWKKKDPTPETAYNEMMTEFYRRVDYTITAYRTLKEVNGSLTDRGRIYILYGKPTLIERSLEPGKSPKEVWKYENLKKTFIFEDRTKQGNYRLAESK